MITQEFTTSKGEFIAVLLPSDALHVSTGGNNLYYSGLYDASVFSECLGYQSEPVGFVKYLTEQQRHIIMSECTADDLISLLQGNNVLLENPFGDEPKLSNYPTSKTYAVARERFQRPPQYHEVLVLWQHAESRTGNWYLLKKITHE